MNPPDIAGIRFRPMDEVVYLNTLGVPVALKDRVIVRLDKGKEIAKVVSVHAAGEAPGPTEDAWRLLRVATPEDLERLEKNAQREREAFLVCESKIKKLRLPMKLLRVKTLFDGSRVTFYFKAANKVDFRQLVRQLAAVFKARIELRQVGARDETELLGGIGVCGRALCCSYWRCRAVKWSREGGANKSKLAGLCNRTLCCLKYESTEVEGKGRGEAGARRGRPRPGADDAAFAGPPDGALEAEAGPPAPPCAARCAASCAGAKREDGGAPPAGAETPRHEAGGELPEAEADELVALDMIEEAPEPGPGEGRPAGGEAFDDEETVEKK